MLKAGILPAAKSRSINNHLQLQQERLSSILSVTCNPGEGHGLCCAGVGAGGTASAFPYPVQAVVLLSLVTPSN